MAVVKCSRAAALVLTLLLTACSQSPDASRPPSKPKDMTTPAAMVPTPTPPLARADILRAVAAAGGAFAAGQSYPEAAKLGGRQFAVSLAVGCGQDPAGAATATYAAGVLRLAIKPETWSDDAGIVGLVAESDTEAIEGFWVRWPWMAADGCPRQPPPAEGQAVDAPTVGLVRLFGKDSSRLRRRGERGYEATVKLDRPPPSGAYRLVVSGRIADPPDHRPVRCNAPHRDRRPICLVLVEPDRVAFETGTGETVAEWAG